MWPAIALASDVLLVVALVLVVVLLRERTVLRRRVTEVAAGTADRVDDAPPSTTDLLDAVERRTTALIAAAAAAEGDEQRLVAALDALELGVVVVDAAGAVRHRNRTAEAIGTGGRADVLVSSTLDELLAAAGDGIGDERTLELFGPPARTLVVRAVPIVDDVDGEVAGALGVVEDVTERQRLESVRRDFVANISHELRTPIGALGLLAEALVDADDPETASRLAGRLGDEVERLTRTIEDLLELSRLEGGGARVASDVAAADVVSEAVERIGPVAAAADIRVVAVPAGERLAVRGDRRQLVSALFNLLDNAVKYSDAGSGVEVRAARDGDEVVLSVVDHGVGIPAADLERVFERFYRVDAARSRTTGGTGLGLAIVRHVAANHGGRVEVRSRAGEGSTFTLRLPAADAAATAAEVS